MLQLDGEHLCVWEQSIRWRRIIRKSSSSGLPWMAGGASGDAAIMSALDVCCVPDSNMVDPLKFSFS